MATVSISHTGNRSNRDCVREWTWCLVVVGLLLGSVSCSTSEKRYGNAGPEQGFGPQQPMPSDAPQPESPFGPTDAGVVRPLTLVLGPGLAKGFAYAGVLKTLEEQKIPVSAIVGTEAGGWIGAIYALSSGVNSFEFSITKFKEDVFFESKLFGKPEPSEGKKFTDMMNGVVGGKDLSQGRKRVILVGQRQGDGRVVMMEKGPAARAVRAVMSAPALFKDADWMGERIVAANGGRPFAVLEARAIAQGPVVVVSVLTKDEAKAFDADLKQADAVIWVNTAGIGYFDFDKRSEAVFRGKNAVQSELTNLRNLAGQKN